MAAPEVNPLSGLTDAAKATVELDRKNSNFVGAVKAAGDSLKTFRFGLERAEPLRTIADEITGVAKKAAMREATAAFKAAGKGKLDPDTKSRITDAFDVAADAFKDGTDNAIERAIAILDVQQTYAEKLTDETQKRIVLKQINASKKLLKQQSSASVGFFGEMMEDIRTGPIAGFMSKLEGNFFGRILTRYATDFKAGLRATKDAEVAQAAKAAEAARQQAEISEAKSEAAVKIKSEQLVNENELVTDRLTTQSELLTAQVRDAATDPTAKAELEAKLTEIAKNMGDVGSAFEDRRLALEQLQNAQTKADEAIGTDIEQATQTALAEAHRLADEKSTALETANKIALEAIGEGASYESIRREALIKSIQTLQETEGATHQEIADLYSRLGDAVSNNMGLTIDYLTQGSKELNDLLISKLAEGKLSLQDGKLTSGANLGGNAAPIIESIPTLNIEPQKESTSQDSVLGFLLQSILDELISIHPYLENLGGSIDHNIFKIGQDTEDLWFTSERILKDGLGVASPGFLEGIKESAQTTATNTEAIGDTTVSPAAAASVNTFVPSSPTGKTVSREGGKDTSFMGKMLGGGMDKIKGSLGAITSSLKGIVGGAMKGIADGIKYMFEALAAGLKKLADPLVLAGATALIYLSGALLLFAGAMFIFGMTNWAGAMMGIVAFALFVAIFGTAAVLLAQFAPFVMIAGQALLWLVAPLLLFAAALLVLGIAAGMFAEIGISGIMPLLAFLAGIAILAPLLAIAGIGLLIASPGFMVFGIALMVLGLGISMFASAAGSIGTVLTLLLGLGMLAPLLALTGFMLLVAAPGYLVFGIALMALSLGLSEFAHSGGAVSQTMKLLLGLALMSGLLMITSLMLLIAAPGYLIFGLALMSLGLGMQMFASVAGSSIPVVLGLLLGLAILGPMLMITSLMLLIAAPGFMLFGLALISLGLGMQMFASVAGSSIPVVLGLLFGLAMLGPMLMITSLMLLIAMPGFMFFGIALMSLALGMQMFASVAGSSIPVVLGLLLGLAMLGPILMITGMMLLLASPGYIIFGLALMSLGLGMQMFASIAGSSIPVVLGLLFGLAMLGPMLMITGMMLGLAAPGLILFGFALTVLGEGMMIFSGAVTALSTGLRSLVDLVFMMPLIAFGIALMVMMLLPLVVPMLVVAAALLYFAFAFAAYAAVIGLMSKTQMGAIPDSNATVTYNVQKMAIDNLPFSFPEFTINGEGAGSAGTAEGIVQAFNNIVAPMYINNGGSGSGGNRLRNDENTFRRVQERFYNSALI